LAHWAALEGLSDILEDTNTPLGQLYYQLRDDESVTSPLDLMGEFAGRHCYRSWEKGRETAQYINNIKEHGHGSVLEHASINLAISGVSRALTHELIRHRAGFGVSQESQRYVEAQDIQFVVPPLLLDMTESLDDGLVKDWRNAQINSLDAYVEQLEHYKAYLEDQGLPKRDAKKRAAEAARASLPNAAETRLVWTGNLRALRHFCELRGDPHADLEIRRLASVVAQVAKDAAPLTFSDIDLEDGDFGVPTVTTEARKV
jgi:thymidylate synthase (FAD)